MGIHGLQKFVDENLGLLSKIQLHDCNVLLDGNSIYHQMYRKCELTCLFGGEYDKLYHYCKQLFTSFQTCRINAIVVFDGARIDNRKLETVLHRAERRVKDSTKVTLDVDLSPLLLRQTFLSVLNDMQIPHVQAIGEGDDECVSLANHLNCYLIAKDSDYYCYNVHCGYISYDYLDIEPEKHGQYYSLSAYLYTVDSLLDHFHGLNTSTLALACCLCGNDYISVDMAKPFLNYIRTAVDQLNIKCKKADKTKHWYTMQWLRRFGNIEQAIGQLLALINDILERDNIATKLRAAVQCYLMPSDTLIYRFVLEENRNLKKHQHFLQLAETYLHEILKKNAEQIRMQIDEDSSRVRTKHENRLPSMLIDYSSDLRLVPSFIEILIHRLYIYSAHVEVENQPSIYAEAIPMLLPTLAVLLKWDSKNDNQSVTFYYRVGRRLEARDYLLNDFNDRHIEFDNIHLMPLIERQNFIYHSLSIFHDGIDVHSDYHLWILLIRRWYQVHKLSPVYLYAIIVSFIRSIFLIDDGGTSLQQVDNLLLIPFDINHFQGLLNNEIREKILAKLGRMIDYSHWQTTFDVNIIHNFNCLQTILMMGWQINEFFDKPFSTQIQPQHFLCGSLLYAFIGRYRKEPNLIAAMSDLFSNETVLLAVLQTLLKCIMT